MSTNVQAKYADVLAVDSDDLEEINARFCEERWSDGLPIVPPTPERVARMLEHAAKPPDELLGVMPPRWRPAYVHHVAVNAVMAGCLPEYFPVVLAGVIAALDPDLNLYGVQGTTNPAGVMLLVNGPIARDLEINSGFNLFGQGWRANATVGRALRLCLINIGGGLPGLGDMSTLGNPNKYGSCIAENEDASPWGPFHVDRGFQVGDSTVTAVATAAPQNVITLSAEPEAILDDLARAILVQGSNCTFFDHQPMVVMGPVQARHVAGGGYDKAGVQEYLWRNGRRELKGFSAKDHKAIREWKAACLRTEDGVEMLYPTRAPEDIGVVVAGGENGPHSAVLPTFNGTRLVTRNVEAAPPSGT